MYDYWVAAVQYWLNRTYTGVPGWNPVTVTGRTGWPTMYALIRALQHELGITALADNFGDGTMAALTKYGYISSTTTNPNIINILVGGLYCKGYNGGNGNLDGLWRDFTTDAIFTLQSDIGLTPTGSVSPKLFKAILNMDAYTVIGSGTEQVREVQQWLNATYSYHPNFALIPCDGLCTRQVQTAMLYALQFEFGMDDATANGNFGPGTRSGLQTQALVTQGSSDSAHRFVRLFQAALRLNGYQAPFNGVFDSSTASATSDFQSLMELPVNGKGDYGTWCALLVSTGDTARKVTGFDTSTQLAAAQAQGAKAAGYTHIGRYTVGSGKFITASELSALKSAGLALFPIQQRYNNSDTVMTEAEGRTQGIEALERCRALGLPDDATIFFAVDYDPVGTSVNGPVSDFFSGVNDVMNSQLYGKYKVGVYGTRNVCQSMIDAGKATSAFVAGMSTGYSGNMGFRMATPWQYNQIVTATENFGGVSVNIDHDIVSSSAAAVDLTDVTPPPTEKDGSASDTGFDVVYQWMISAEAACERSLHDAAGIHVAPRSYGYSIPEYILGWLRKPDYWDGDESGPMWHVYTPELTFDQDYMLARATCETALNDMTPDIRKSENTDYRKTAHMAAALLGLRDYQLPSTPGEYGIGELGSWLLDLLSLWGQYTRNFTSQDLSTWLTSMIGKIGGMAEIKGKPSPEYLQNPASLFSYADVLADADAWLITKATQNDVSGRILSNAMRNIYQEDGNARIKRFYQDRFASNPNNVISAFITLTDGIDVGSIENIPLTPWLLRQAADVDGEVPQAGAMQCAQAYAAFLANPHRQ